MAKTQAEVVARAHRTLGLLAADEVPTADMNAFAGNALEGAIEELAYVQGLAVTFDKTDVPDELFLAVSDLLAAEIAPHYGVNGPSRSRAIARIRASLACDDR